MTSNATMKNILTGIIAAMVLLQGPSVAYAQAGDWCGTPPPKLAVPPEGPPREGGVSGASGVGTTLLVGGLTVFSLIPIVGTQIFRSYLREMKNPNADNYTVKVKIIFLQGVTDVEKNKILNEKMPLVRRYFHAAGIYLRVSHDSTRYYTRGTTHKGYWGDVDAENTPALNSDRHSLRHHAEGAGVWESGAIHVFIVDEQEIRDDIIRREGKEAAGAFLWGGRGDAMPGGRAKNPGPFCWVKKEKSDGTIAHEIGHCLGLYHTFETKINWTGTVSGYDRCRYRGDYICDTPFDVDGMCDNLQSSDACPSDDDLGEGVSCATHKLTNCGELKRNIMSYYSSDDEYKFTADQGRRMRRMLEVWKNPLVLTFGRLLRGLPAKSDCPKTNDPAISSSNVSVSLKSGSVTPGSATFNASFPSGSVLHYILFTGRYRGPSSVWTVDHFVDKTAAAYGRSPGTNVPIRNKAFGSGDIKLEGLSPNTEYTLYSVAEMWQMEAGRPRRTGKG